MQNKHTFIHRCVDFNSLLSVADVGNILKVGFEQSKIDIAYERYQPLEFADGSYKNTTFCAPYFGAFGEWFLLNVLDFYGSHFNIHEIDPVEAEGSTKKDLGTDAYAKSIKTASISGNRTCQANSSIFIQVKTTLDEDKIYFANDNSRLPNFAANAFGQSIVGKSAYQSRFIVITTGKELYHTLHSMTSNLLEVINRSDIERLVNGDTKFLNYLRTSVGLTELNLEIPTEDAV